MGTGVNDLHISWKRVLYPLEIARCVFPRIASVIRLELG